MLTRGLPGNYCDELEQIFRKVHKHVANNISLAQKRQKEDYDKATKVESTQLKPGDRVWLNSKAIPKGKSRKFHQEWTGPYVSITTSSRKILPRSTKRIKETMEHENRDNTYCNWNIGTVAKKLKKRLESIGIETKVDELQKSVILDTARILRKVLEVCGD